MIYDGEARLYKTTAGEIVSEGDERAAFLVASPGTMIQADDQQAVKAYLAQQEKAKKPAPKSEPKSEPKKGE